MDMFMSILSFLVLENAYIIILFIIWGLVIIVIEKVIKMKIKRLYRIVSLIILFFVFWNLPIYISYNLIKKSSSHYFHKIFYYSGNQHNTFWFGIPTAKNPLDMWVYQEIIHEIKPDLIIECGTAYGGSALFFANLCDLLKNGKIITIDIEELEGRPKHNRIIYLHGSSTSEEIISKVKSLISNNDKVLVSLDSDHHKEHVLKELYLYSKLVSKGSYIVVEDTNINNHPVLPSYGEGPMEAVNEFLKNNRDFVVDRSREKYLLTFFPNGWLKKIN